MTNQNRSEHTCSVFFDDLMILISFCDITVQVKIGLHDVLNHGLIVVTAGEKTGYVRVVDMDCQAGNCECGFDQLIMEG